MILYFYLHWIGKRPEFIEITTTPPKEISFQCQFKSHEDTIIVCGNISNEKPYLFPKETLYSKPQYLMSHLQKSVRLMESMKSLQTAKHLLHLDIQSFIRRLPIIMLEDVYIHSSITVVIWLMIALSKKYSLTETQVKWLFGVIYSISNNQDCVIDYQKRDGTLTWEMNSIPKETNTLLYSLRFRQNYGGMKGDMKMIEDYIYKIIHQKIKIHTYKIPIINIDSIQSLNYKDWIYQANDFHCNRSIPKQVISYIPKFSEEYCKKLIWENSSSINKRNNHTIIDCKNWDEIKKIVKHIQKRCIFY